MPQLDAPTATLIGAIVGGGVASLIAFISQTLSRRSEEKRAFRQLIMQAAIENWKQMNQMQFDIKKINGGKIHILPLDLYIIHMLKLMDILDNGRRITPENVTKALAEVHAVGNAALGQVDKQHKQDQPPQE